MKENKDNMREHFLQLQGKNERVMRQHLLQLENAMVSHLKPCSGVN